MMIVVNKQVNHCTGLKKQEERSRERNRCQNGPVRRYFASSEVTAWNHSNGTFSIRRSSDPEALKNLSSFFLNLWSGH